MNAFTKQMLDFQTKENKMVNYSNSAKEVIFSNIELTEMGLNLTYKTYNTEFECGGWNTKVNLVGNIDKIVNNLNHLIFECVEFNKRKFEDIKIYKKTSSKNSND